MVRGAVLAVGGVLLGGGADLGAVRGALADSGPSVYSREEWGARHPRYGIKVLDSGPDHIVVHHTATANVEDYSRQRAFALSRAIQNHHMDVNGWNDTGQQITISRGGYVMEGRRGSLSAVEEGEHVVGAHVANHNDHTIGIENEGTYMSTLPPTALLTALIDTCAWLCLAYRLNPVTAIVGHRDYNSTNCPGDELYELLPKLRTDTTARVARLRRALPPTDQARQEAAEVPEENHPTFPDVPRQERTAEYYHGPALGKQDADR
ncbi:peptidoglycan recognition protein family protein [Actinorugispora endophytica]|uniref:N-acetyl-anhydromuramyl-L-alanine amidase AmpD n=1 Tax=Actinorugispora endophytica TaxID=1605990 RepID=A0A4R6V5B0_9ACTN|nr:peptidoglycan recognition family protein [Actinorugispora endophytica]TDQ55504.1 N-acetyl-anhydromuramyl-L-alanine amidase AmpD [Actinorugispora endophytica]